MGLIKQALALSSAKLEEAAAEAAMRGEVMDGDGLGDDIMAELTGTEEELAATLAEGAKAEDAGGLPAGIFQDDRADLARPRNNDQMEHGRQSYRIYSKHNTLCSIKSITIHSTQYSSH